MSEKIPDRPPEQEPTVIHETPPITWFPFDKITPDGFVESKRQLLFSTPTGFVFTGIFQDGEFRQDADGGTVPFDRPVLWWAVCPTPPR